MKKWMRKWRQQSKVERMEKWRKKGQRTVLCLIFLLHFSRVLAATFLFLVSIFFPCLVFLLSISYLNFPRKPMWLPLLLHFSKTFPCPGEFLLPDFIYFIIFFVVLSCTPFLSLFSISFSCTSSSPSSLIALLFRSVLASLHLPALFHLVPKSCWKFHGSTARLATLLFLRPNHCLHHPLYQNLSTILDNLLGLPDLCKSEEHVFTKQLYSNCDWRWVTFQKTAPLC